ncbi:MAG: hypothetical protein Ta2G_10050 [Termitinemataceae bacterium]|nr:MAG: hypothetical protein Ta2G_10050 [Termitinemataceae bacterium]
MTKTNTEVKVKKKRKLSIIDIIVIVICLSAALIALLFFWRDLNATLEANGQMAIGNISFKRKTAQRRFGDRIAWQLLQKESSIYGGDLIHTSDSSDATIYVFDGGQMITLDENSLIQIIADKNTKGIRIDQVTGTVHIRTAETGATISLKNNGVTININSNSMVSAVAGGFGNGGIQVIEGSAELVTSEGVSQQIVSGDSFSLDSSGNTSSFASASLLSPKSGSVFLTALTAAVNFNWKTSNTISSDFVRFEIASDPHFSNIVQSADVRNTFSQNAELSSGNYWWRIYIVSSEDEKPSDTVISNKLTVVSSSAPPLLQSPGNGTILQFRKTYPSINFKWASAGQEAGGDIDDDIVDAYIIEVSNNTEMSNPKITETVKNKLYLSNTLGEGRWYWRVRPVYPSSWIGNTGELNYSPIFSFTLERNTAPAEPPALINPADAVFINIEKEAPTISFSWSSNNDAVNYTFELANDLNFSNLLISQTVNENRFVYYPSTSLLKPVVYFWRVRYTDDDALPSEYSLTRHFSGTQGNVIFESVFPPNNTKLSGAALIETHFIWRNNLSKENVFEIASDVEFNSIALRKNIFGTEYQYNPLDGVINEGSYFWRVTSTVDGKKLESEKRTLTIRKSQNVDLLEPQNGAEIDGIHSIRGNMNFVWDAKEPITKSRLLLSRSPNPKEAISLILDIENPGRKIECPPLNEGTYYWIVEAFSRGGIEITPTVSSFKIMPVPRLAASANLLPEDGTIIDSDRLRQKRSIDFSWDSVNGANTYLISIYKASDRSRSVFATQIPRTQFSLNNLSVLDVGDFVWEVEALVINNKGVIEQHGLKASSTFKIDIAIPSNPKLKNERTYGY